MKINQKEIKVITTNTRDIIELSKEEKDSFINTTIILYNLKDNIDKNKDLMFISHKDFDTIQSLFNIVFELKDEYMLIDENIDEKTLEML